jgi:tight adherence protein C
MEAIFTNISTWIASANPQQVMIVLLAAGAIGMLALGISYVFMGANSSVRRRLNMPTNTASEEAARNNVRVDIQTLIGPVAQWLIPSSHIESNKTMRQLAYSGFRSPNALPMFYFIKAALFILLPVIALFVVRWFPELTSQQVLWTAILAAVFGLFAPNSVLNQFESSRLKRLRDGFPDALDMLVVCVESGLGLSAAIQRVADEIGVSHPELAIELAVVNAETRAGVDRAKALKNFADRSGIEDIRGLVSMLIQAMRFGTSIADTLRVYSEEYRDKRQQKAEESAATIGTKLIFPLVLCLFPAFFIVAIGPAVIRLVDAFSRM